MQESKPPKRPLPDTTTGVALPVTPASTTATPPMTTGRKVAIATGTGLAVLGILLIALVSNNLSICSSGLGQFAQSLSSQANSTCTTDGVLNIIGWLLLLSGTGLAGWTAYAHYRQRGQ